MVGVLIITHGNLGSSLAGCAEHILGRAPDNLDVLAVEKTDDPEQALARARDKVARLDTGEGVLVLTDIFGATPSNIASRLIEPGRVEAVAGVNVPMLVRALCYSSQSLDVTVSKAVTGGLEGVLYIIPGEANA
ncbi:PTS sugar transporter subunit IIA [Paludibacterium paludis]|uniref:PTS fructose transporter subunit IIA n=1 Tax=Paludibacterium paludis TaxID=1225769 RepID=A0A918P399_9NEIS|nr:PTS sugar transporter subunit IIA [Paludibacterium paludis]GGY16647.1 PTS fructose transporter subunit IIA [Paludibacterium paludis]